MLGLFKTKEQKIQENNAVIQQIHNAFYTEVDKLLAEAKCTRAVDELDKELVERSSRLQSLGFKSAPEVAKVKEENARISEINKENRIKREFAAVVEYFSMKYPYYKFITEESVAKICQRYNLIYGEVGRYTGTVPDKNLKEMEKFGIREEDECYMDKSPYSRHVSYMGWETYQSNINYAREQSRKGYNSSYTYHKAPLEICAPLKDFNTEGMELKNFKLTKMEIPDPVVLKPVFHKGNKYYLIVTAWGLEASDELVMNERFN